MKRYLCLLLACFAAITLFSCSAGGTASSVQSKPAAHSTLSPAIQDSSGSVDLFDKEVKSTAEDSSRRITVQCDEIAVTYALNDSRAADALLGQLPLTLALEDYGANEKIFYPSQPLDIDDAPLASGGPGTLAYYAPWGDVVFFYGDFSENPSLYALGEAVSGIDSISRMSGTVTVSISE